MISNYSLLKGDTFTYGESIHFNPLTILYPLHARNGEAATGTPTSPGWDGWGLNTIAFNLGIRVFFAQLEVATGI